MSTWGRPTAGSRRWVRIGSIWSSWCLTAAAAGWSVRQVSRSGKKKKLGLTHITTKLNLPGSARHRSRRWILGVTLALAGPFAGTAAPANSLQNVTYDAQPGGRVQLTLAFSESAPEPKVFTTSNPAPIAIDLTTT